MRQPVALSIERKENYSFVLRRSNSVIASSRTASVVGITGEFCLWFFKKTVGVFRPVMLFF